MIPELKDSDYEIDLQDFCVKFAHHIGLLFFTEYGSFWEFRKAERNIHTTPDKKKKMLTSLITMGQLSDIKVPDWARKQEY